MCTFDDGPVRVSVDYDRVVDAHVVKVVSADTLEWVCWQCGGVRWSTWL